MTMTTSGIKMFSTFGGGGERQRQRESMRDGMGGRRRDRWGKEGIGRRCNRRGRKCPRRIARRYSVSTRKYEYEYECINI